MLRLNGNLWYFHNWKFFIIIPTNGTIKIDGTNVMGRGLAKQAAIRYKDLPKMLGDALANYGNIPFVFPKYRIITFPVKHKWQQNGDLELLRESAERLVALVDKHKLEPPFYLPRVGCGNAKLDWDSEVEPVLKDILDDRFIVVHLVEGKNDD